MLFKPQTLALLCLAFLACKNDPKTDAAKVASKADAPKLSPVKPDDAATYTLTEGTVSWAVKYVVGKAGHEGTIKIESGELWVSQGQIISGNVSLDMNSIGVSDIKKPEERMDLESHLKDSDFFDTNAFPKAQYLFTGVMPSTLPNLNGVLTGDLTLKGITAPVNIPFKMSIEGDILRAESPSFPINRTTWGVNFQSGILGTAKDKMVEDNVSISLMIVAKKK